MAVLQELLVELHREAAWENSSGANAAALSIVALPGEGPLEALIAHLKEADEVDLSDDAGDVGDELYRLRRAIRGALVAAGPRVIPLLRGLVHPEVHAPRVRVAVQVLAALQDASLCPLLERWALDDDQAHFQDRLAAIEALGLLKPVNAVALLREALTKPGALNQGWLKRIAAIALGRLGEVGALEVLLDDPDWFARLGVAEALSSLPADRAENLRARARADVDARVRAEAK